MVMLLVTLLTLAVGSFINVVVYRLPRHIAQAATLTSLLTPSSCCIHCERALRWYDMIPVLSWILLRGRCRDCHSPIGCRYPATEIATLLLSLLLIVLLPADSRLIATLLLAWALLALSLIDMTHLLLPDAITLPLLWLGLLLHSADVLPGTLHDAVTGAAAGYGVMRFTGWCYQLLRNQSGVGQGDAKLLAALGAWLGLTSLPVLLIMASGSALIFVTFVRLWRFQQPGRLIPFGPWLSLAGISLFIHSII
ncbi:prepilin peptidase [Pantoea eucrina]|uniref:prepilin peptidase n=1 Tax=Pantoea eucrina TaxID=472693 RepID=UPI00080F554C|nr:A24 family peptidase [Pantoea eucrina]